MSPAVSCGSENAGPHYASRHCDGRHCRESQDCGALRPRGCDGGTARPLDVARAARVVPGATCLVQALAAEWPIRRGGAAASLRFGVAKGDGGLDAHAWLESGGRVLLGGDPGAQFTTLTPAEHRHSG
ncbi:MAG: lasso peptide biosynthesis B2 protein [Gemmatimonadetes bacterium]|nr:lasso peptide biosynthesis B2 protein [Gemmatimonadota bacterium]